MNILVANKFYFVKGGAERYFFELTKILERHGHSVFPFSMKHERNVASDCSDLFVSNERFDAGGGPGSRARAAARVLYSREARNRIEALVERASPDVAHLHNIAHQLSPSILYGLRAKGVPVVQTLHDYKLVCPNYQMFVDGLPCERCGTWRYYNAVVHRCMRDSLTESALVCAEAYAHRLLGTYRRCVDLFIAPSRWLRGRMIAHGVDASRIVHMPYAIEVGDYEPRFESDGSIVYFGRLSIGKGLETLVAAMELLPDVRLRIVGDGPIAADLRRDVERRRLANVEFLGHRTGADLKGVVSGALAVVVPSECYENSPLVVYEASALGKAVVGSKMGGIPELVVEGETGLLFEPRNSDDLARRVAELAADPARAVAMGRAARDRTEREYGPGRHYESVMEVYERVIH